MKLTPHEHAAIGEALLDECVHAQQTHEADIHGMAKDSRTHALLQQATAQRAQGHFQAANVALLLRFADQNPGGALDLTVAGEDRG